MPDRRHLFTADARFTISPAAADQPTTLTGYALVWNVPSSDRGGYKVRLNPGSARFADATLALFHHDFRDVLGSTVNKTLRIAPDEYGVKVEIDLPNTSAGRDVAELVRRGDVRGMSFAMVGNPQGKMITEGGDKLFVVDSFNADEVTVTAIPAFTATTIDVKPPEDPQQQPASFADRIAHSLALQRMRFEMLSV